MKGKNETEMLSILCTAFYRTQFELYALHTINTHLLSYSHRRRFPEFYGRKNRNASSSPHQNANFNWLIIFNFNPFAFLHSSFFTIFLFHLLLLTVLAFSVLLELQQVFFFCICYCIIFSAVSTFCRA